METSRLHGVKHFSKTMKNLKFEQENYLNESLELDQEKHLEIQAKFTRY